jgi:uncharacterized protein (TIGR01777 family)
MGKNEKKVVVICGGNGLVGKALTHMLDKNLYRVIVLSRYSNQSGNDVEFARWDTKAHTIEPIPAPDYIVNLAGEGIAEARWTENRKNELISSRVESAKTIRKYLMENNLHPACYVTSAAVGYYGDRVNEILTEESKPGQGFLAQCCIKWEDAAVETGLHCQRNVILRTGIVLSHSGGAWQKMLMTKKWHVFNYFGSGKQYFPWIHIDDLCRLIIECIENQTYTGVINAVAPQEVSNKDVIIEAQKALGYKGVVFAVPSRILHILMGEMSSVLLSSLRVSASKVQSTGFKFKYNIVSDAIKNLICQ